ncbi:MAG: methyltransferase domain-containing protein [Chloroflexi bacterium]|nr:methyltransferase domain-containing protein [Chloroflexota bacterium]
MSTLSEFEARVYNAGERLIPGVTHDVGEFLRHRASYAFWRAIIVRDVERGHVRAPRILDLGCGVGHGCKFLATLPGAMITGIDNSPEAIEYARKHYAGLNITYQVAEAVEYVAAMNEFDYIVSRNVLEHIPNGLDVARAARWRERLCFDVPYGEQDDHNPHHHLHTIDESMLSSFANAEILYQDAEGALFNAASKPERPNVIMCIASRDRLPNIDALGLVFPLAVWEIPNALGTADHVRNFRFLENKLEALTGRKNELAESLAGLNRYGVEVGQQLATSTAQQIEIVARQNTVETWIDEIKAQAGEVIEQQTRLSTSLAQITEYQGDLVAQQNDLSTRLGAVIDNQGAFVSQQNDLSAHIGTMIETQGEVVARQTALDNRLTAIVDGLQQASARLAALEAQMQTQQAEFNQQLEQLRASQQAQLAEHNAAVGLRLDELDTQQARAAEQLTAVQQQFGQQLAEQLAQQHAQIDAQFVQQTERFERSLFIRFERWLRRLLRRPAL